MTTNYIVIMTHNFDAETYTVRFGNDLNKAKAFLHWSWEKYLNNEIEAGSNLNMSDTIHEDEYARVCWEDGCYTEFILSDITEKDEEFEQIDWEKYL